MRSVTLYYGFGKQIESLTLAAKQVDFDAVGRRLEWNSLHAAFRNQAAVIHRTVGLTLVDIGGKRVGSNLFGRLQAETDIVAVEEDFCGITQNRCLQTQVFGGAAEADKELAAVAVHGG